MTGSVSDSSCRDNRSLCILAVRGSIQAATWMNLRAFQRQRVVLIRALTTILCFQLLNEQSWFPSV